MEVLKTPVKLGTNPGFSSTWHNVKGKKKHEGAAVQSRELSGMFWTVPSAKKTQARNLTGSKFLPHLFHERQQLHTFKKKKTFDTG